MLPNCPKCNSSYTYEMDNMFVCPECAHEWSALDSTDGDVSVSVKDANGNELKDGDSITIIKDLKVKGSSAPLKQGTKVKNIRLIDDGIHKKNIRLIDDGIHNIDCKIDGFGAMKLKSEFVKKL